MIHDIHMFFLSLKKWCDSNRSYEFIDSYESLHGSSWQAGACTVLALALLRLIPRSTPAVVETMDEFGVWKAQHVAVRIESRIGDSEGFRTVKEVAKYLGEEHRFIRIKVTDITEDELMEYAVDWTEDILVSDIVDDLCSVLEDEVIES